ncbi:extracellular solute-binding protein [Paenibacillus sp. GCM10027626]|uniref:extracellular solute-binding protein n=1 Tax=Paenibacillus sp. GCM10027626 TaxID=3273411 RepID=UPI003636EE19
MKKLGLKTLLAAMIASLVFVAACNSGTGSSTGSPSSSPSGGQPGESGGANVGAKEEYVIKMLTQSPNAVKRSDESAIGKIIKEKFNIVFEYVQSPGNMTDKLNLMLAGGDYPEIVAIQDNQTFDKYARSGALLPLDDFVKAAPEFKERYKVQIPLWKMGGPDGKLYKWESFVPIDFENNVEVSDIGVRIDTLKEQGWPNLLSTDDYIRFLKQALQDHPTTNGQKTIGMVVPFAEPWGMQGIATAMYEKGGRYSTAAGNMGVLWKHVDQKFEDTMTNEYVKESLAFFNKLYREGILDKDSFTDKMDQVQEKLNSGRALSVWYTTWGLLGASKGLIEAGNPELQYINMPIRSMTQVERNEKRQIRVEDSRSSSIYAITKNAKHPERILELLGWAATEEGRILLQSGIEGEHYTIVDGKRVPTESFKKMLTDAEVQKSSGLGMPGIGQFDFLGYVYTNAPDGVPYSMYLDPKTQDELQLTAEMRDAYAQLGWKNSKDYFLRTGEAAYTGISATIAIDSTSELGALHQRMVDFRVKNSAKLIVEPKSDEEFESLYQTVIEEYAKLNPQSVVDEYNRLYQEKQAQLAQLK